MPEGSSSAAPVIRPGPSCSKNLLSLLVWGIRWIYHLGVKQDDEAFLHHPANFRENLADFSLAVDYRNHYRLVVGNSEETSAMPLAMAAEAHHARVRRSARHAELAQTADDRLV